jgi:hypothetical protein
VLRYSGRGLLVPAEAGDIVKMSSGVSNESRLTASSTLVKKLPRARTTSSAPGAGEEEDEAAAAAAAAAEEEEAAAGSSCICRVPGRRTVARCTSGALF